MTTIQLPYRRKQLKPRKHNQYPSQIENNNILTLRV